MKLNPDCIRAILLAVESNCDFHNHFHYLKCNPVTGSLSCYSHEEIIYHIRQCSKSGLIDSVHYSENSASIRIGDLSPAGHEFLANIRNDTFFNKVKSIASELGVNSLDDIRQIALNAAVLLIKGYFHLP